MWLTQTLRLSGVFWKIMEFDWKKLFDKHKKKAYSHIDTPCTTYQNSNGQLSKTAKNIIGYITNEHKIARHSFLPFIGYNITERHVSKIDKTKTREEQVSIAKIRPIRCASHFDSMIYAYYTHILYTLYEEALSELELGDVVLAYRKSEHMHKIANNITFAREIFDIIKSKNNRCLALAFDIKSFYDYIDHKKLKQQWALLLNKDATDGRLPPDHYNIYKSLTNYSFIDINTIKRYLQCWHADFDSRDCKKCPLQKNVKLPKKLFKDIDAFHKFREWCKTYDKKTCSKYAFNVNNGILDKTDPYGIPQGSPISALLANIYMLPFDKALKEFCDKHNATYRRYSDDILIICDLSSKDKIYQYIMQKIREQGKHLTIHPIEEHKKSKSKCYDFSSDRIKQNPLQYLGFTFDGNDIKIRGSSIAKYLRKSKRGITSMRFATQNKIEQLITNGVPFDSIKKKLYRRQLYKKYTHLGKNNFWCYVNRAFYDMSHLTIKKQMRKHFERIKELIDFQDMQLKLFIDRLKQQ